MSDGVHRERLSARRLTREYPGVVALDAVDFAVRDGEIHGLVGENGAGKSTLIKILSGFERPTAGTVEVDGTEVGRLTPAEAHRHGVVTIYQDRHLVPGLSVAENVLLGGLPARGGFVRRRQLRERAAAALARVGAEIDPGAETGSLSVAGQQLVELAAALCLEPRVLILDEPTACLGGEDARHLVELVRRLRDEGVAVVYISHHLEEVLELADRITVLRDGAVSATVRAADADPDVLVGHMVGRELATQRLQREPVSPDAPVLVRAGGLSRGIVIDASLELRAGEIAGVAGMVGSGRTELARLLCGIDRPQEGTVEVAGRPLRNGPRGALRDGIIYVSEDRRGASLVLGQSSSDNMALARRGLDREIPAARRRHRRAAAEQARRLHLAEAKLDVPVAGLSGGNQQKVVLGRWLRIDADVFVFDEPTQGVDVGAKAEIHQLICDLANAGKAVLVISSDAPELIALCDRVLVMRKGRIAGEVGAAELSEERILALAVTAGEDGGAPPPLRAVAPQRNSIPEKEKA